MNQFLLFIQIVTVLNMVSIHNTIFPFNLQTKKKALHFFFHICKKHYILVTTNDIPFLFWSLHEEYSNDIMGISFIKLYGSKCKVFKQGVVEISFCQQSKANKGLGNSHLLIQLLRLNWFRPNSKGLKQKKETLLGTKSNQLLFQETVEIDIRHIMSQILKFYLTSMTSHRQLLLHKSLQKI